MTQTPDTLRAALEWAQEEKISLTLRAGRGNVAASLRLMQADRTVEKLKELEADLSRAAPTPEPVKSDHAYLVDYVVAHGALHVDDCSGDDTCECVFAPVNAAVNRLCRANPEPVDLAALRAAVKQMQGKSFDFDSRDFVLRADVLRLLTGGTERSGS